MPNFGLPLDDSLDIGMKRVSALMESDLRATPLAGDAAANARLVDYMQRSDYAGALSYHAGLREANVTDDFSYILSGNIWLKIKEQYQALSQNWRLAFNDTIAGTYNAYPVASLAGFNQNLPVVREGQHYTEASTGEYAELGQIAKYGQLFSITREMLKNDNKRAFAQLPQEMGYKAAWTVNSLVADVLESTTRTLTDGKVLFHADHGNLTSAATPLTWATLQTEITKFMAQKDIAGNPMNIFPTQLIIPPALLMSARLILQETVLPTQSTPGMVLPMSNAWLASQLQVVPLERLSNTVDWYLSLDKATAPIEVAFLDGRQEPEVFMQAQDVDFDASDGIRYKIRLEVGAYATSKFGIRKIKGA